MTVYDNFPTIIERLIEHAKTRPDKVALRNPLCEVGSLTYGELYTFAFNLSRWIIAETTTSNPIVVFGHKNPFMIVCFLACVLSGHAYCPVDSSMPKDRVDSILEQTQSEIVFAIDSLSTELSRVISLERIHDLCQEKRGGEHTFDIPKECVKGEDTFYIIFTSGSTGKPKGVEISMDDLNNFLRWSITLGEEFAYGEDSIFLNQAPFSFDLSVMDLYSCLYCGGTLCMMEKSLQKSISSISPFLKENLVNVMVATPSFVNLCLLDKSFCSAEIPSLNSFFFCGEVLTNKTARKVKERFPNSVIQNTYGPTESTVAVSNIRITDDVLDAYSVLPVGRAKPETDFIIAEPFTRDESGHKIGEVLICGNTLAKGYFKQEELTKRSFTAYRSNDELVRAYRTGDLGYVDQGLLFYCGRIDLQIKLNGFRIELGDIENCLLQKRYIESCAVIGRTVDGKIKGLVAVVVLAEGVGFNSIKRELTEHLKNSLPDYMIPKMVVAFPELPMTGNGKIDRKKIAKMIEEI